MGLTRRARQRDEATFDLTPMIDVVLLLIIFFMLTSQFAQSDRAGMNLPEQSGFASAETRGAELVIDIDRAGATSVLGRPITLDGIVNEAITASRGGSKAASSGLRVLLRADRDCPASAVQNLCAGLINAGIRTVSLGTSGEGVK